MLPKIHLDSLQDALRIHFEFFNIIQNDLAIAFSLEESGESRNFQMFIFWEVTSSQHPYLTIFSELVCILVEKSHKLGWIR
jgi:hypothetical protein